MNYKYHNKKCVYKGLEFDSRKERDRYIYLESRWKKGEITNLERQKEFVVLPKITKTVAIQLKTKVKYVERVDEQETKYHCDFYYYDVKERKFIVEEVKSEATRKVRDYSMRRKLLKLHIMKLNQEAGTELFRFNEIIM